MSSKHICKVCKISKSGETFSTWDDSFFFLCDECKCATQILNEKNLAYEENYWHEIVDPDGKKRNLLNEKSFKVKNWYGDIINVINKKNKPKSKIIDVGAGLGHLISEISDEFEKYAIDISEYSTNYIKSEYPNIKTYCGKFSKNLFKKNFFDTIISYHVIEHLEGPIDFIKDLKYCLKSGGTIILGTPNRSCLAELIYKGNFRLYSKQHITIFTKQKLIQLLKEHGFKIKKIEFPFFNTSYFTFSNILKLLFKNKVSPPFYGSIMTIYAEKI